MFFNAFQTMGVGRYQMLSKWAWAVIKRYQPLSTGLITFDNV